MAAIAQENPPLVELAQSAGTVKEIIVDGTQRIEPDTVKSYLLIQEGDSFEPARIDRSLKSLFATGLFADVTLRRQGDALLVKVVENPVINRIAFEGNDEIGIEDLEAEVALRPRVIYTRTKVQNDVKRVLGIYRGSGYFAATVEPKVIQLPQNRIDLVFEIHEGEPTAISSIRFVLCTAITFRSGPVMAATIAGRFWPVGTCFKPGWSRMVAGIVPVTARWCR